MHLYQLETLEQDQSFLNRGIVECSAVVADTALPDLKPGAKLVVKLSNRSKYMAIIVDTRLSVKGSIAEGTILIQRQ